MQREIKKADMSDDMVKDATHFAQQAIGQQQPVVEARVAQFIKEKFDASYGAGWQCIVGKSFGSFVSYESGHYIHFKISGLEVLLYRAA